MTLHLASAASSLMYLKNAHSEADTAVWLPKERVLWAAAAVGVKRYPNIRPFLTIPDILASIKLMRALARTCDRGPRSPHDRIFDEMERYLRAAARARGQMARERQDASIRSRRDQDARIRRLGGQGALASNVDAAWRR